MVYVEVGLMEIICHEGRVFGSRYYTAGPKFDSPFLSIDIRKEWDNMMLWCVETFGPSPINGVWTPNARWYANNAKFWFRQKKDLEWFILRWQ